MSSRQEQLAELQSYIKNVDKEVTMILQSLQWDRTLLMQAKPKETCKYNANHKIPPENLKEHEEKCVLKCQGYASDDVFLPDVFDPNASTVIKLSPENIKDIINYASKTDPVFKRGNGTVSSEPLTMERLLTTYTADERRAIYDVVITSRPACDELSDLALGEMQNGGPSQGENKHKSKIERLAELRDMRRRRTKYRVAAHCRNYSHTLRTLIDTQMEMYAESRSQTQKKLNNSNPKVNKPQNKNLDKSSDNITIEQRGIEEKGRYKRRNHHGENENKRKRDYEDHKNLRNIEKDRYKPSTHDRETHDDRKRHKRQERSRDYYREEINSSHSNDSETIKRNTKEERYRERSLNSAGHSELEKKYYKNKDMNYIKEEKCSRERYYRKKGINYIKEERDSFSSSSSRDISKYPEHKKEEQNYEDKDKSNTKVEKGRHTYYSRNSQKNRATQRDEQYYRDKDRYGHRHDRMERR